MKTSAFKQQLALNARPEDVYDVLMSSKKHSKLTGSAARISTKVGGTISVFDGYASGKNVELEPGKRIVQTWRAVEDAWPEGHDSIIIFDLSPLGKNRTKLLFEHRDVPAELAANFKQGWIDFYWTPLKTMFTTK